MKKTTTSWYDVSDYLRTPGEIAAYMEAIFEGANGGAVMIAKTLGNVAWSTGVAK